MDQAITLLTEIDTVITTAQEEIVLQQEIVIILETQVQGIHILIQETLLVLETLIQHQEITLLEQIHTQHQEVHQLEVQVEATLHQEAQVLHLVEEDHLEEEDVQVVEEVEEDAAYAPYLVRQDAELRDLRASDAVPLGQGFPYAAVPGLSREMVERLEKAQPETLAAAGRLAGITPAALASLLVHARRRMAA